MELERVVLGLELVGGIERPDFLTRFLEGAREDMAGKYEAGLCVETISQIGDATGRRCGRR